MAKVIVTGSINMDVVATTDRRPRPGETVRGSGLRFSPGGKGANQSVAAARVGANVLLLGNVGDDRFAPELTSFLEGAGIDISAVQVVGGVPTGVAVIVVDARGENSIVVVGGANEHLDPADVDRVPIDRGDVAVAQFEIRTPTVVATLARARARGAMTILNAAPAQAVSRELNDLADVLVVNESELNKIAGSAITPESRPADIHAAVSKLSRGPLSTTVVTLGARGAVAVIGDRRMEVAGRAVDVVDTTGAGDCFVGALAARLAAGAEMDAGLAFANVAASICVERPGAGSAMPTAAEVRERES